jgi:hypothetical protein
MLQAAPFLRFHSWHTSTNDSVMECLLWGSTVLGRCLRTPVQSGLAWHEMPMVLKYNWEGHKLSKQCRICDADVDRNTGHNWFLDKEDFLKGEQNIIRGMWF